MLSVRPTVTLSYYLKKRKILYYNANFPNTNKLAYFIPCIFDGFLVIIISSDILLSELWASRSRLGTEYSISHFMMKQKHLECDSVWKTLERWSAADLGDMLTLWLRRDLTVVMKTLNWDRCIWQSDNNAGTSQCCFLVPRSSDSFLINICIIK